MDKDIMKDFNDLMDGQIARLQKGLAVQTEIMVLKDIKRLASLGAFVIEEEQPILKTADFNRFEINKRVRLKWQGEEELKRLKEDNDELRKKLDKFKDLLDD